MRASFLILVLLALAEQAFSAPATALRRDFSTTWMDPDAETMPVAAKVLAPRRVDDYPFETFLLEGTLSQRVRGSSTGRLLAVDGNGVVHGVYLTGATSTDRRPRAWCLAPDGTLSGPETIINMATGYPSAACTGAAPINGLPAHSGVAGLGSSQGWFGTDFQGCSLAFLLGGATEATLQSPYIAVDYRDQIHGLARVAGQDSLWLDLSMDGQTSPGPTLVSGGGNVLAAALSTARQEPAGALLFLRQAPCTPSIVLQDAPQWGMDLYLVEARDTFVNLRALAQEGDTLNLTRSHCADGRGPMRCGAFAYRDADALYDNASPPRLHVALTTPRLMPDTLRFQDLSTGEITATPVVDASMHSGLWHLDVATGQWSRIAGWMCGEDEEDEIPWPEIFRVGRDRVQLAHDPLSGHLYAMWNAFSRLDVCSAGQPNGELWMACSADGGIHWGPAVNITQSATPGCLPGECASEVGASLAEEVSGGFLHLSFLLDTWPDDETLVQNSFFAMRVPVEAVPPPGGPAWDAAGHVALDHYQRPWWFTEGHPESLKVWDSVGLWNEGEAPRRLLVVEALHHFLDQPQSAGGTLRWSWDVLRGDPVSPQGWMEGPAHESDWNGLLPPRALVQSRVWVAHLGMPIYEQAFRFTFDDGTRRLHRFVYEGPNGQGSLVLPLDVDDAFEVEADTLYQVSDLSLPRTKAQSFGLRAHPNPFNPDTELSFQLDAPTHVRLGLWNVAGQQVARLLDADLAGGLHRVRVDGQALAAGLHVALLEAGDRRDAVKLLLVK